MVAGLKTGKKTELKKKERAYKPETNTQTTKDNKKGQQDRKTDKRQKGKN